MQRGASREWVGGHELRTAALIARRRCDRALPLSAGSAHLSGARLFLDVRDHPGVDLDVPRLHQRAYGQILDRLPHLLVALVVHAQEAHVPSVLRVHRGTVLHSSDPQHCTRAASSNV